MYEQNINRKNGSITLLGVVAVISLVSLALGMWIGGNFNDSEGRLVKMTTEYQVLESQLVQSNVEIVELNKSLAQASTTETDLLSQLAEVLKQAADTRNQLDQASAELNTYRETSNRIESLENQINNLQASDGIGELTAMSKSLNNYRLLLVELRKELPITRIETSAYWHSLKSIAVKADPSLASPADKVILKIDNYFDWMENAPPPNSPSEDIVTWQNERSITGALDYNYASANFTRQALLSVIVAMDTVVSHLE